MISANRKATFFCLLFATILAVFTLFAARALFHKVYGENDITSLTARISDKQIHLSWEPLSNAKRKTIQITISGLDTETKVELPGSSMSYLFEDGEHGCRYDFLVQVKEEQTGLSTGATTTGMFLDQEKLPDLPLLNITTASGDIPVGERIDAPLNAWGTTSAGKDYVDMRLTISQQSKVKLTASGKIRVRGNTSSLAEKKGYKLELKNAADLMFRNDSSLAHKEWVLLDIKYYFQTEVGLTVAALCHSGWQPTVRPVNLIVNDDWLGCYLLAENISVSANRLALDKSGFLIENDAYWWDAEGSYFKTSYQRPELGYTFVYPPIVDPDSTKAKQIRSYMEAYEKAICEGMGNYTDYLDVESAAAWVLTHDIMANIDSGGTNMYLYKNSLTNADIYSDKLMMGPLWDFDACYAFLDAWAPIHWESSMHFDTLFKDPVFRKVYVSKWEEIAPVLVDTVNHMLEEYISAYGYDLEESWKLDSMRWKRIWPTPTYALNYIRNWMSLRKEWLDNAIEEYKQ